MNESRFSDPGIPCDKQSERLAVRNLRECGEHQLQLQPAAIKALGNLKRFPSVSLARHEVRYPAIFFEGTQAALQVCQNSFRSLVTAFRLFSSSFKMISETILGNSRRT